MIEAAIARAGQLLDRSETETTPRERRRASRLAALVGDPRGRDLLHVLTDEVLRIRDPRRAMRRLAAVVSAGLPCGLSRTDRWGLQAASRLGLVAPRLVAPLVDARIRHETRSVVLPAEQRPLRAHIARRRREGMRLNVNLLGEAVLGDAHARERLHDLVRLMERDDVDYVSVKISALCANLDVVAFEHSVGRICEQLRAVYRAAQRTSPPVFVNLDMEEYRDLELTVAAFCTVLDEIEFRDLSAGIVLQAYIPDSHAVMAQLCQWATARAAAGGAPIKVRVVKGANLAMERVEAELHGWQQAPYAEKSDVDASFKRLVLTALRDADAGAVRLGVASHNLFDVAWALELAGTPLGAGRMELEMLEGMAPAQARVVRAQAGGLLLYAPVARRADRDASIAYLSRRLDENSAPQNFLRHLFTMRRGSAEFEQERDRFASAARAVDTVSVVARRTQDRSVESSEIATREDALAPFANEPETDFTRPANRRWVERHLRGASEPSFDRLTSVRAVDAAVERARQAAEHWAGTSFQERATLLRRVAATARSQRGVAIASMARETSKIVREGDVEVCEAIDATLHAAERLSSLDELCGVGAQICPRGVVAVVAPWNFPYAIPMAGVVAALAAGNAVLLKPAPEAERCGSLIVSQLHAAGVPPDLVQLAACPEDELGQYFVTHDGIDEVTLTGAYDTARMFLDWKPSLRLTAETSGKNSIVITAAADLDLAIADLVRSAFGHAGQKCSAASLAIVEAAVYDDPSFHRRLADAVTSVRVGPAGDLATMVPSLIRPPDGALLRGLTVLDAGERWLVEPRCLDAGRTTWTPGVRRDVAPGSWFHQTECFGPVLGLMRADDLHHAIEMQNGTVFGLTGGLHSLDPDEIAHWCDAAQVGNAYVNRHITGAIVRRQPFGGWKRSAVGPSLKPGGPNVLFNYSTVTAADSQMLDATPALASYRAAWRDVFSTSEDVTGLRAEANLVRYRPLSGVVVRTGPDVDQRAVALLREAGEVTATTIEVSIAGEESEQHLAARIASSGAERLRALVPIGDDLRRACHDADVAVDDAPVTGVGRIDLLRMMREQTLSITRHRHGRLPGE